jgi:trehalose 2-sulfotransferase
MNAVHLEDAVQFEFDAPGEPQVSYLICSVPRSGSNLLCDLLSGTGVAGAPTELFHPDFMRILKQRWEVETTQDYVAQLLARKTGPNGVFGVKAHWDQYHSVFETTDPRRVLPNLQLISITRRDHLRQAVSMVGALQTLRWKSTHPERPHRTTEYDAEDIARKLGRIKRVEELWTDLFDRYGIEPHRVIYEDFVADQSGTLRGVLEFIGVAPPAKLEVAPTIERQADALSEEWVERYIAETAHT